MSTLITTEFGFESTAKEVVAGLDLSGKRIIVTGGASGIGTETTRALAEAGADVTIAARRLDQANELANEIDGDVKVGPTLDLSDLKTVKNWVEQWEGPLDVLVNNAGVMAIQERTLNNAGLEMQFATNHVGHFALAVGLHDALKASEGTARIVSVSSTGHLRSPVHFDDINFDNREYTPFGAYGQSKTANVLFAVGATDRWANDGILANALMPGGIATPLQRHVGEEFIAKRLKEAEEAGTPIRMKSTEQGAATTVLLAVHPALEGVGGRYFESCNESEDVGPEPPASATAGVASYAVDRANADKLWALSEQLTA